MLLKIFKNRTVSSSGTWGTKNENNYEILNFEFPEELEEYNKRIVYYLGDEKVWDAIVNNKAILTNAITTKGSVEAYIWCTKSDEAFETDVDFRTQIFVMNFFENENADGIVPTEQQVDGFNTMLTQMNDAIDEIDDKIDEADAKIQQIDEAITGVENLNIDVSDKVDGDVTVTLTKKDNTTKTVVLSDGTSLEFMWEGTSLGIKTEDDTEYTYVDLQGVQGPVGPKGDAFVIKKTYSSVAEMNADFNNMQVGDYVMIASTVELEDNAKLYTKGEEAWIFISDFSGAQGIKGETGATPNIQIGTVVSGSTPNVTRTGTNENPVLNFTLVPGEKGDKGDKGDTGATGNGIASIDKTSTVGYVDTYTITYTNGNTTTFTVTNGEVTQQMLDNTVAELQQEIDELSDNMPWAETEQATEIQVTDAAKYSKNKLELFGNTEQASTTGKNLLDTSLLPITAYGITISKDSTGNIVLNGTPDYSRGYKTFTLGATKNIEAGTYTISVANKQVGIGVQTNIPGGNLNLTMAETTTAKTYTTTDTVSMDSIINIRYDVGTLNNFILNPQFELNSTATDYEPYTNGPAPNPDYPQDIHVVTGNNTISIGNTNYPINLGSLELCKIGDYQDYLYKENGNWYKYNATTKVVLNGTESWNYSGNVHITTELGDYATSDNIPFSTKYVGIINGSSSRLANYQLAFNNATEQNRLYIKDDRYTTSADFKTYLQGNNVPLYYGLREPTSTQITDETLIAQLDAIYEHFKLVKGTNNITITAEDLAPYMQLNYMQDQQKKFENIINSTYTNVMEGEY